MGGAGAFLRQSVAEGLPSDTGNGAVRQSGEPGRYRRPPGRKEVVMWTKPEYTEMRYGFEVTMYIANR